MCCSVLVLKEDYYGYDHQVIIGFSLILNLLSDWRRIEVSLWLYVSLVNAAKYLVAHF